jgi:hypothetical protein
MCPVCGNESRIISKKLGLSECGMCAHIWETELKVRATYDQRYVAERYDAYDTTEEMSHLRLGLVQAYASGERPRMLDVGYGNGSFVKLAIRAGFDAYGYDVHGADYGVPEAGLNSGEEWDVVTFFDSLEHIPDLTQVKDLAKRTDYVIVSYPSRPRGFPKNALDWKHFRPGEHLHYFCSRSIAILFDKTIKHATALEDVIRGSRGESSNIMTLALR